MTTLRRRNAMWQDNPESLDAVRYAWIGKDVYENTPPNEHALHYASTVLCAFSDQAWDHGSRDSVKNVLLNTGWTAADPLPANWMRYRNISEFEVCGYILPALVRYHLAGGVFDE